MNPPPVLPDDISDKFRFWSLVSMVLLVFVHAYNYEIRYLRPWTVPAEALDAGGFLQYLLANGLLRFRIPLLFAISGFLFAWHDHRPHGERVRQRTRTLLLPYLAWSGLWLALLFVAEQWPAARQAIANSTVAQIDASRVLVSEYTHGELLLRWWLAPLPYQLWFVRALFVLNVAYPLLARALSRPLGTRLLFGFALLLWATESDVLFVPGEALLFFTLGVWLQKRAADLAHMPMAMRRVPWATLFVGSALLKTWLAFVGQRWLGDAIYPVLALLHKVVIASGLVAMWFGSDTLVRAAMRRRWFAQGTRHAFIIYAAHAPLVAMAIDPMLALFSATPVPHLLAFVLLPPVLVALSVALGLTLERMTPGLYGLLTGGRGLRRGITRPAGTTATALA